MDRHQHPSNNDVLGAPAGMPIELCSALAITRVEYAGGVQGILSWWKPTGEELKLLNEGKSVRLGVLGVTHPPVYVGVEGDGVTGIEGA